MIATDTHGNRFAQEGCDRCACGCKYWESDRCVSCGEALVLPTEELRQLQAQWQDIYRRACSARAKAVPGLDPGEVAWWTNTADRLEAQEQRAEAKLLDALAQHRAIQDNPTPF